MRKSDVIKPIAVSFQEGRRIGSWGNTFFWGLLKSREIESYLDGNRRKVVVASAEAYIAKKLAETKAEQIAEVSPVGAMGRAALAAKRAAAHAEAAEAKAAPRLSSARPKKCRRRAKSRSVKTSTTVLSTSAAEA
jgi:hypothetical protein